MALSRRLFLGGLLTAAAAPAIVTSKGFREAICGTGLRPIQVNIDLQVHGTHTGRLNVTEPAWQELSLADRFHPHQREAIKRILFCQRYGTTGPFFYTPQKPRKLLVDLDFSRMEQRVLATRFG